MRSHWKGDFHDPAKPEAMTRAYQCKVCEGPATKGVVHDGGQAMIPTCDKDLSETLGYLATVLRYGEPDKIVGLDPSAVEKAAPVDAQLSSVSFDPATVAAVQKAYGIEPPISLSLRDPGDDEEDTEDA